MPMLTLKLNKPLTGAEHEAALAALSSAVAEGLSKPERYVMVCLQPDTHLMFAGDTSPAAAGELASIGLSASQTAPLSKLLCGVIERQFAIPADRVFIVFRDVDRPFWGWDAKTF